MAVDTSVVQMGTVYAASSVISVPGGGQGEITVFPLSPGTSTKIYLERHEVDRWVRQTSTSSLDYVLVSTPTSSLSVAAGSTSAQVTFPTPVAGADYVALIQEDGKQEFKKGTVLLKGGGTVFFTGLKKNQKYRVTLNVNFRQASRNSLLRNWQV